MKDYTVVFKAPHRVTVGVKGASCATEAESMARAQHPECADTPVYDICRVERGEDTVTTHRRVEKELSD